MDKIIAATFDIADQVVKTYNAYEWHNFIADTREWVADGEEPADLTLEELFDEAFGDEFWFEVSPDPKAVYQIGFDLRSEEFFVCQSDAECEFVMATAEDCGDEEEIFWS